MMYCVDCGEDKPIFKDGSCLPCYLKNHHFTSGPAVIDISYCTHCGSLKYKNTWSTDSFEQMLKRYVKQLFTISKQLRKVHIEPFCEGEEHATPCTIRIVGMIQDEQIVEEHQVQVRMHPMVCDVCSRQTGGYYEAILQIRPWEKKLEEQRLLKIQTYIEDLIYSMQEKGNRKLFITDQDREHGGLDYYLSDKQAAASIIKQTQEMMGGEITVSSKNVGMKAGQQVYRMTYLLRLYPFKSNDFLVYKDTISLVGSVSKNMVHLIDLRTWSSSTVEAKNLELAAVYSYEDLVIKMIVVSQTKDEVQVMHSRTYEVLVIRKPTMITYISEQIEVVEHDQRFYLLPALDNKS